MTTHLFSLVALQTVVRPIIIRRWNRNNKRSGGAREQSCLYFRQAQTIVYLLLFFNFVQLKYIVVEGRVREQRETDVTNINNSQRHEGVLNERIKAFCRRSVSLQTHTHTNTRSCSALRGGGRDERGTRETKQKKKRRKQWTHVQLPARVCVCERAVFTRCALYTV